MPLFELGSQHLLKVGDAPRRGRPPYRRRAENAWTGTNLSSLRLRTAQPIMLLSDLRVNISARDGTANVDLSLSSEQRQLVDSFAALYARLAVDSESACERLSRWVSIPSSGSAIAGDRRRARWRSTRPAAAGAHRTLELALIAEQLRSRTIASAPRHRGTGRRTTAGASAGDAGAAPLARPSPATRWSRSCRGPRGTDTSRAWCLQVLSRTRSLRWSTERLVLVPPIDDNRSAPVENLASMPLADIEIGDQLRGPRRR